MGAATVMLVGNITASGEGFVPALNKRYELVVAASGKQALALARKHRPRVIVLEATSMRTPGERICRTLHERLKGTPIIHIHPGPREEANSPADVLLFLPFTYRKLINAVERLLQAVSKQVITCGPFEMHIDRRVLVAHGQETPLTPKLARLVEVFLRHPGETLDRKRLMETVWDTDYLGDTRTLDVHIRWIRQALELDSGKPRFLKTVRGVGYRLEVPRDNGTG